MRWSPNSTTITGVIEVAHRTRTALLAVAAAAAVAGAIAVASAFLRPAEPGIRVAFSLTDHRGGSVSEQDFAGRHLLVFFGFTNCAMICPTQMGKLTAAMARLDDSGHGSGVTPLLISVDPERDTPERLARFLTQFDSRFVGLTGSRPALTSAAASFRSYLQTAPPQGAGDYQVVHATTVYVVNPESRIVGYISGSGDAEAMAVEVRKILG